MFEKDKNDIKYQELLSNVKHNKSNQELFKNTLFNKNKFSLNKENIISLYRYIPSIIIASLAFSLMPTLTYHNNNSINDIILNDIILNTTVNPTYSFTLDLNNFYHNINIHISKHQSGQEFIHNLGNTYSTIIIPSNEPISDSVKEALDTRIDDFKLQLLNNQELKKDISVNEKFEILNSAENQLIEDLKGILKPTTSTVNKIENNSKKLQNNNIEINNVNINKNKSVSHEK